MSTVEDAASGTANPESRLLPTLGDTAFKLMGGAGLLRRDNRNLPSGVDQVQNIYGGLPHILPPNLAARPVGESRFAVEIPKLEGVAGWCGLAPGIETCRKLEAAYLGGRLPAPRDEPEPRGASGFLRYPEGEETGKKSGVLYFIVALVVMALVGIMIGESLRTAGTPESLFWFAGGGTLGLTGYMSVMLSVSSAVRWEVSHLFLVGVCQTGCICCLLWVLAVVLPDTEAANGTWSVLQVARLVLSIVLGLMCFVGLMASLTGKDTTLQGGTTVVSNGTKLRGEQGGATSVLHSESANVSTQPDPYIVNPLVTKGIAALYSLSSGGAIGGDEIPLVQEARQGLVDALRKVEDEGGVRYLVNKASGVRLVPGVLEGTAFLASTVSSGEELDWGAVDAVLSSLSLCASDIFHLAGLGLAPHPVSSLYSTDVIARPALRHVETGGCEWWRLDGSLTPYQVVTKDRHIICSEDGIFRVGGTVISRVVRRHGYHTLSDTRPDCLGIQGTIVRLWGGVSRKSTSIMFVLASVGLGNTVHLVASAWASKGVMSQALTAMAIGEAISMMLAGYVWYSRDITEHWKHALEPISAAGRWVLGGEWSGKCILTAEVAGSATGSLLLAEAEGFGLIGIVLGLGLLSGGLLALFTRDWRTMSAGLIGSYVASFLVQLYLATDTPTPATIGMAVQGLQEAILIVAAVAPWLKRCWYAETLVGSRGTKQRLVKMLSNGMGDAPLDLGGTPGATDMGGICEVGGREAIFVPNPSTFTPEAGVREDFEEINTLFGDSGRLQWDSPDNEGLGIDSYSALIRRDREGVVTCVSSGHNAVHGVTSFAVVSYGGWLVPVLG